MNGPKNNSRMLKLAVLVEDGHVVVTGDQELAGRDPAGAAVRKVLGVDARDGAVGAALDNADCRVVAHLRIQKKGSKERGKRTKERRA